MIGGGAFNDETSSKDTDVFAAAAILVRFAADYGGALIGCDIFRAICGTGFYRSGLPQCIVHTKIGVRDGEFSYDF